MYSVIAALIAVIHRQNALIAQQAAITEAYIDLYRSLESHSKVIALMDRVLNELSKSVRQEAVSAPPLASQSSVLSQDVRSGQLDPEK